MHHIRNPWIRFIEADAAEGGGESESADDQEPEAEDPDSTDADETEEPIEGEEKLGDPGKKALDSMKAKLKAERALRRDAEAKLNAASKGDEESAHERELIQKANSRILRSEVKAQAAGKLADPKDALRFLDLDQFEVSEDGDIDEDEIADAISDLLERKPYLAAQGGRKPRGSMDGGVRKESRPQQVTRDQLARMSPDEIETARKAGRLKTLMGGK